MNGPSDDDRIRELLLSGNADKFADGLSEIVRLHVGAVSAMLKHGYPGLRPDQWDDIWNTVFQDIHRMASNGTLQASGDLRRLLYALAWCRASTCLRGMLRGPIDWRADIVDRADPLPDKPDLFHLVDGIQCYVKNLPVWKQDLLVTAVQLFLERGDTKLSQVPLDALVKVVNDLVDPPMTSAKVEQALYREWRKLRAFLRTEGY